MLGIPYIRLSEELDSVGLVWQPEIGDEVSLRKDPTVLSILVDPNGMTPGELRTTYLWLPTIEQLVSQIEARQAILFHTGLELTGCDLLYKTVVQAPKGHIESIGASMRLSVGIALRDLITEHYSGNIFQ